MLLITFGRAATQELRDRVRRQIVDAVVAFDDPAAVGDNQVIAHLLDCGPTTSARCAANGCATRWRPSTRRRSPPRISSARWCSSRLGVAGDSDSGVTLVESLDELVGEIVDDLYLRHFGQERDDPLLSHADALKLAREVVKHPATELRPKEPPPDSRAAVWSRSRKMFWPNWRCASAAAASSATTTC